MENAQRAADCLVALTMELRATLAGTKHYMLQYYVLREALQGLVLHKMDPNDQWKMLKSQMELRILSSLQAEDRLVNNVAVHLVSANYLVFENYTSFFLFFFLWGFPFSHAGISLSNDLTHASSPT